MELSFPTLRPDGHVPMYVHEIPEKISERIAENLELETDKKYILSFSRFVDYDPLIHGLAIQYFLSKMENDIERKVVGEDTENYKVSYLFKNTEKMDILEKEQILFLCGVFHQLDLKTFLLPCVAYLMQKYALKFVDIKNKCKSDSFKLNILIKS